MTTPQIKNRSLLQKNALNEIKFRGFLAIALLVFFLILGFAINRSLHHGLVKDFEIINLTGRQRALTQKIALLSSSQRYQELSSAVQNFNSTLIEIKQSRFARSDYPFVQSAYLKIDKRAQQFTSLATGSLNPTTVGQIFKLSQDLYDEFDRLTLLKQQISETELKQKIDLENLIFILTLIVLILEVVLFFKPIIQKVKDTFTHLNHVEDMALANTRLSMIGEIASTIGHEIKNPLAVILAQAELSLRKNEIPENESGKTMMSIEKNAQRIKKLIDAISIQARESSQDKMLPALLKDIINDAVDILEPTLKEKSITLERNENFDSEIICRRAAISQVVANLIANAIDSISENPQLEKKVITITTEKINDKVFLRISDSGPGVPEELSDKIFNSFVTTKESGKGTGLGLAISRKIIEEHNGKLQLKADISNSCFEIELPG